MFKFIRRLFCKHTYETVYILESKSNNKKGWFGQCLKCGKVKFDLR